MAINQYIDSFSNPSADIQNLVANEISLLDQYILFQTNQNEYTALIKNVASKDVKKIVVSRISGNGFSNIFNVTKTTGTFDYDVTNEYYVYSNVGLGKSLDLPVYDGVISYSLCILTCCVLFGVVFKGVLFKCLKRRKR